jgi:hypothetical protein
MKTQKKQIAAMAFLMVLAFALGAYASPQIALYFHRDPRAYVNVYYTFTIFDSAGASTIISGESGNLITGLGENYARDILGFDNVTNNNATKWISLSNDATPLATWTKLPNEVNANGFSRVLGTVAAWINVTHYAYNVSYTFTASGTQQLQCVALQWNNTPLSDNNLYAAAAFTQTTFNSGDTALFTYVITYAFQP